MYSLRYGTLPIVRATGGLDDTVTDPRQDPALANGIKFTEYTPAALVKAMQKALALYGAREIYERYQRNAMHADFSWKRTAEQYLSVYRNRPSVGG